MFFVSCSEACETEDDGCWEQDGGVSRPAIKINVEARHIFIAILGRRSRRRCRDLPSLLCLRCLPQRRIITTHHHQYATTDNNDNIARKQQQQQQQQQRTRPATVATTRTTTICC